jgi:acetyl-CoA synthase
MGFPVIADTEIPEIRPTGICTYEHVVRELDHKKIVPTCVEVRGVKVKIEEVDIPVPYAAAFEGERVRREDMQVEFGGKYSTAFEYLRTKGLDEVEDGKVQLIGPDADTAKLGGAMPLGILVEVAGRKMQKDFESIIERQFHTFLNEAMGIFHMGQRNIVWMRISKDSFAKGFRLKHFGTILHAQMHSVYGKVVDKVAVTIWTDEEKMRPVLEEAMAAYSERDERVAGMTDESVDTFYSCTLCQSYAPNHVQWENVNRFVFQNSNRAIQKMNLYSIMEDPMTSCGCFECILAIVPEANGFMIVNREHAGMTPCGMTFSTLAGSVGGGSQTPGFLGVGRLYVASRKFVSADGGLKRMVWMPKELKDFLAEKLAERAKEIGIPNFVEMIADETVAESGEDLVAFLEKVGHPALTMDPLM